MYSSVIEAVSFLPAYSCRRGSSLAVEQQPARRIPQLLIGVLENGPEGAVDIDAAVYQQETALNVVGLWGDGHLRPGDRLAHTGQEGVRQPLKVPRVQVQLALALPGKAGVKGQKGDEILDVGGLLKVPQGGVHGLADNQLL